MPAGKVTCLSCSEVVDVLMKNGADINLPANVGRGYTHSVGSSLITLTQDGATPLYIASQEGHSDTVNTLIRNGANVNQPMKVLYTTIHSY